MALFQRTGDGDARRHAPAAERNRDPILAVLRRIFPDQGQVLEIACGTGQHACHFARALPGLSWLPTDPDPGNRASVAAWAEAERLANLQSPQALDVTAPPDAWPVTRADAMLCVNMIHIAPWAATLGLFAGAARLLTKPSAPIVLYGPYKRDGRHTADSNAAFDADLRARNPEWGVRDLNGVAKVADDNGFFLEEVAEMPANNLTVVFRRS